MKRKNSLNNEDCGPKKIVATRVSTRIAEKLRSSTFASSTLIATRASARIAEMSRSPVASSLALSVSVSRTVSRIETATTPRKKRTPYPKRPKHCQKVVMVTADIRRCEFEYINPEHYPDPLDEWRKGIRDRREWKFEGKLKLLSDQQFQNFSKNNRDWFIDESEERGEKRMDYAYQRIRERMRKYEEKVLKNIED